MNKRQVKAGAKRNEIVQNVNIRTLNAQNAIAGPVGMSPKSYQERQWVIEHATQCGFRDILLDLSRNYKNATE